MLDFEPSVSHAGRSKTNSRSRLFSLRPPLDHFALTSARISARFRPPYDEWQGSTFCLSRVPRRDCLDRTRCVEAWLIHLGTMRRVVVLTNRVKGVSHSSAPEGYVGLGFKHVFPSPQILHAAFRRSPIGSPGAGGDRVVLYGQPFSFMTLPLHGGSPSPAVCVSLGRDMNHVVGDRGRAGSCWLPLEDGAPGSASRSIRLIPQTHLRDAIALQFMTPLRPTSRIWPV